MCFAWVGTSYAANLPGATIATETAARNITSSIFKLPPATRAQFLANQNVFGSVVNPNMTEAQLISLLQVNPAMAAKVEVALSKKEGLTGLLGATPRPDSKVVATASGTSIITPAASLSAFDNKDGKNDRALSPSLVLAIKGYDKFFQGQVDAGKLLQADVRNAVGAAESLAINHGMELYGDLERCATTFGPEAIKVIVDLGVETVSETREQNLSPSEGFFAATKKRYRTVTNEKTCEMARAIADGADCHIINEKLVPRSCGRALRTAGLQ
jgi:hypothetical protein